MVILFRLRAVLLFNLNRGALVFFIDVEHLHLGTRPNLDHHLLSSGLIVPYAAAAIIAFCFYIL